MKLKSNQNDVRKHIQKCCLQNVNHFILRGVFVKRFQYIYIYIYWTGTWGNNVSPHEMRLWICNHIHWFMWNVITRHCPNEVRAWMNNYIPLFYVYVITYPCPNPNASLSNLCKGEARIQDMNTLWNWCEDHWLLNGSLSTPHNPLYSLTGDGVSQQLRSGHWVGWAFLVISKVMSSHAIGWAQNELIDRYGVCDNI